MSDVSEHKAGPTALSTPKGIKTAAVRVQQFVEFVDSACRTKLDAATEMPTFDELRGECSVLLLLQGKFCERSAVPRSESVTVLSAPSLA